MIGTLSGASVCGFRNAGWAIRSSVVLARKLSGKIRKIRKKEKRKDFYLSARLLHAGFSEEKEFELIF